MLFGKKRDISSLSVDGPYIAYEAHYLRLQQVKMEGKKPVVMQSKFPEQEKDKLTFTCEIDGNKPSSFNFTLHEPMVIQPTYYPQPGKLLALSDIEGNFHAFQAVLKGNQVIDDHFDWTFGEGHLVLVGDLFDRGLNVMPCLWLMYKLEQQAIRHGGHVHLILGNHEIMVLEGDDRYVRNKYLKLAGQLQMAYQDLFGSQTELGRWLRTKNIVEKIGNTLFVHGGISRQVLMSGLKPEEMNEIVRRNLGSEYLDLDEESALLLFNGNVGPVWYRGYFPERSGQNEIDPVLKTYQVDQVVVGHTVVPEISSFYNECLFAIDILQPQHPEDGPASGLWMEQGKYWVTDQQGKKSPVPRYASGKSLFM